MPPKVTQGVKHRRTPTLEWRRAKAATSPDRAQQPCLVAGSPVIPQVCRSSSWAHWKLYQCSSCFLDLEASSSNVLESKGGDSSHFKGVAGQWEEGFSDMSQGRREESWRQELGAERQSFSVELEPARGEGMKRRGRRRKSGWVSGKYCLASQNGAQWTFVI